MSLQTAEILSVGSEVDQGEVVNTNAALVARELFQLGLTIRRHTVVGDDVEEIAGALREGSARSDVIVMTGGLGPTSVDLTREGAAMSANVPLIMHPECLEQIRSYFEGKLHRGTMPEENKRQALMPEGSEVLVNDWGTAPGFHMTLNGCEIFALPGVPRECEAMLRCRVLPWLRARMEAGISLVRTLRTFGMAESAIDTLLKPKILALKNPTLALYAKSGEIELRMTAKASTAQEASGMLDALEAEVRQTLGDIVYGRDVSSMEEVIVPLLKEKNLMLCTAESCTGGLIAKRITDIPGASLVFKGGIVSYSNEAKENLLGVPHAALEQYGAVSPQTAQAMAQGARKVLNSDLAVSATGLAGPETDEFGHTGGTVFLSLTDGEQTWTREIESGTDRARVRTMAAHTALDMVRRYLTGAKIA